MTRATRVTPCLEVDHLRPASSPAMELENSSVQGKILDDHGPDQHFDHPWRETLN